MIYCDTSLIVSALTLEVATANVQQWLEVQAIGTLCASGWVAVEVSSALSMKFRRGDLTAELRMDARARWQGMQEGSLDMVEVPFEAWELATRFADRAESGLRAGDALHIAIASLGGHSLATLDHTMAEAASALGVDVKDIPSV